MPAVCAVLKIAEKKLAPQFDLKTKGKLKILAHD